jgi:hypothetical protein
MEVRTTLPTPAGNTRVSQMTSQESYVSFLLLTLALFIGMTKQEFILHYDKSVYEVRLELAMHFYEMGDAPEAAFNKADQFIDFLKTQKKAK